MDNKVELQILNITNSQAQVGAYALLLGEIGGERQLPIIIGPAEAQSTTLCLKGIKTPRPLTHELFTICLNVLGTTLLRVLIYKAKEGVFYSYIYLRREEEIIRVDARTSDAVSLAVRSDAPIYIYESILDKECLRIKEGDEAEILETVSQEQASNQPNLEEKLDKAIREENYELAARLRDEIQRRK